MAEIRFNYGDKFTQTTNSNTGIGSTIPAAKLDIAGGSSAGSLRVSGIATLSSYQGFVNTKLTPPTEGMIVEAGNSGSVSGEIVVGTGQTMSVSTGATTGQGGIQSLKVYETFMPPVGGTADRPTDVKPGMVYYNKDFKTIEFWDGNFWKQVDNTTRRGRGVFSGGGYPVYGNTGPIIEFIQISTLGNTSNFGTNTLGILSAGNSDSTRGTFSGGFDPFRNVIEYITMASEGNTIDFGDLTGVRAYAGSASSSTRGLIIGGYQPTYLNIIDYIEIQTLGNALDFGDCTRTKAWDASTQSPVRGVFMSGTSTVPNSGIDFVITSSKGNAVNFGETTKGRRAATGGGNSVRGIFVGGYLGNADQVNTMDYVTLASEGNAIDFGDNLFTGSYSGATSNGNRMVIAGGYNAPATRTNSISHVTIATTGNAQEFGDMSSGGGTGPAAVSDSHGGLGGF